MHVSESSLLAKNHGRNQYQNMELEVTTLIRHLDLKMDKGHNYEATYTDQILYLH